jgi:glycosyltransferase involved in cell wall biosynthesis
MVNLSFIIPVYNESKILEGNVNKMVDYLDSYDNISNYEILLCDNGSKDDTLEIANSLAKKNSKIKALFVEKKGMGGGIKSGIKNAEYDICFFNAIDLPFGLDIIDDSLNSMINRNADVVIGSKEHKKSIGIRHDIKRIIFSRTYNLLINLAFNTGIKDTQGTLMFKKSNIYKFFNLLSSSTAFFETQLVIYSKLFGHKIIEIPVDYSQPRKDSKVKCIKDGWSMFKELINEYKEYRKVKEMVKKERINGI